MNEFVCKWNENKCEQLEMAGMVKIRLEICIPSAKNQSFDICILSNFFKWQINLRNIKKKYVK